jgi:hypothetical protein
VASGEVGGEVGVLFLTLTVFTNYTKVFRFGNATAVSNQIMLVAEKCRFSHKKVTSKIIFDFFHFATY